MFKNVNAFIILVSILLLSFSIVFMGFQIQKGLTNFRDFDRSVRMKGLAETDVTADLALWSIGYTETGNDLNILQDKMDENGKVIIKFLKKYGIQNSEIQLQQVEVQDLMAQSYRQNQAMNNRYILKQSYLVRSENIDYISKAAQNMGDLIRQGVVFSQSGSTAPTYLYTKLNDIKPEMIAQATRNAKESAGQFAQNSQAKVGGIKRASQGVFQILPRDKTYALPEAQQKNKTVRVVSTIEFYLVE